MNNIVKTSSSPVYIDYGTSDVHFTQNIHYECVNYMRNKFCIAVMSSSQRLNENEACVICTYVLTIFEMVCASLFCFSIYSQHAFLIFA